MQSFGPSDDVKAFFVARGEGDIYSIGVVGPGWRCWYGRLLQAAQVWSLG
jgi:hypothetical protein